MRAFEVIRATEGEAKRIETPRYRITDVPYKGLSRGFGEFMDMTWHMVEPCEWVCWIPADIEYDIEHFIEASKSAPSEFWALSLSADSHLSHAWTRRVGAGWREVPFVDLAPVYSFAFATSAHPHFHESKSGWGLDLIFAHINRKRTGFSAHVCDDFEIRHTKKLESQNWLIDGLTPMQEMARIKRKYNL